MGLSLEHQLKPGFQWRFHLSPLAASEVVMTTTSGAANGVKTGTMITFRICSSQQSIQNENPKKTVSFCGFLPTPGGVLKAWT